MRIGALSSALAFASVVAVAWNAGASQVGVPHSIDKGARVVPGEVLVDFVDDVDQATITRVATELGAEARPNSAWSSDHDKFFRLHVAPADVPRVIARLTGDPRIEHVEPMGIVRATFVPNDPMYKEQWHLARAGAERAWEYGCGLGVTVAVIDTGVACYDHAPYTKGTDLAGTKCEGGWNFVHDSDSAFDDEGHGTHVAGTVAQTTNNGKGVAGMAFCARIMPVKVLNEYGWGTVADVAEGIRWAADHGAQVINLSLGSPWGSPTLEDAIRYAAKKKVVIVAAAGNEGGHDSVGYPAAYPEVIAVSATDPKDEIAWFSSRGKEVDIAAPGVKVVQQTICDGGQNACELFDAYNGTSMASPHVAGAAALLVGLGITDPDAVRAHLQTSARPKGPTDDYGAGLLDAGGAARRVALHHLLLRVGALVVLGALVARRVRSRGGAVKWSSPVVIGALVSGVGLLAFAPFVGLTAHAGVLRPIVELLARPFGEWDLVASASLHRFLPLANALPTIGLAAVGFGHAGVRRFLGGFALGAAALLVQLAWSAEVTTPIGSTGMRLFAIANALVCLFVARLALEARRA